MNKGTKKTVVEKLQRIARVRVTFEAALDLDTAYGDLQPKDADLDEDLESLTEDLTMAVAGYGSVVGDVHIEVVEQPTKVGTGSGANN